MIQSGCFELHGLVRGMALDAREFDELIARIAQASSRRSAVKGVLGGALAGAGMAAAAEAKHAGKGKKGRKGKGRRDVASEHNGGNGKRTLCLCKDESTTTVAPTTVTSTSTTSPPSSTTTSAPTSTTTPTPSPTTTTTPAPRQGRAHARELVCETKTFKTKKAKKALRDNPGSYRGPCVEATTTTSTSTSTTTFLS